MTFQVRWLLAAGVSVLLGLAASMAQAQTAREIALIEKLGKQVPVVGGSRDVPLAEILEASKMIDEYIEAAQKENKVSPNPMADDTIFVRRAYLDIVGRIPSFQETLDFQKEGSAQKRSKLIDQLLDSEGYVSNNFNYWADILRLQTGAFGGESYALWLKDSLRQNKPFNQVAYEMVTSSGYAFENGAVGFFLRDDGMPLDHLSSTTQVLLGTSMVCAQCHDHPFDQWTRREFYEMAAFTYGVETRTTAPNVAAAMQLATDPLVRRALDRMTRALQYAVSDSGRKIVLPEDYQYDDGKPGGMVKALTIFGDDAKLEEGKSPRDVFAKWMTSPENPRFTMVIANRLWKRVMGWGLFEPVDWITDDTEPSNPKLMEFLVHKMAGFDCDMKQYLRMLYNTRTYQREVAMTDPDLDKPYYFPGPMLRRMTAEQFWDSLVTLVVPDLDQRKGYGGTGYVSDAQVMLQLAPEELLDMAVDQARYDKARQDIQNQIREARLAGDEKTVKSLNEAMGKVPMPTRAPFESRKMLLAQQETLKIAAAPDTDKNDPKKKTVAKKSEKEMMDKEMMMMADGAKWQGIPGQYMRASELGSPAGATHFLGIFGQADRDVISNASYEPTILQVLAAFNGETFQQVCSDSSLLMQNVNKVASPNDKVSVIFLSALNRRPTSEEMKIAEALLSGKSYKPGWNWGMPSYSKLIWGIINTREFSFIQ